jgi:hypothetical protein
MYLKVSLSESHLVYSRGFSGKRKSCLFVRRRIASFGVTDIVTSSWGTSRGWSSLFFLDYAWGQIGNG